jgi:hypothetical protein
LLLRFRCNSCGRTFNALTKTPMAHLRKKDRWLDHALAMIEGKSLAKTAEPCGVHPTMAFRWRHRFLRALASDKPRTLSGIVEVDETFVLESLKGQWSDLPRRARKRAARPDIRAFMRTMSRSRSPATGDATFDAVQSQVDGASVGAALARVVTPGNHLVGDGGNAFAAFARRARTPFHLSCLRPESPIAAPPHLHINNVNAYRGRLEQWLARFNGVATKDVPTYLGRRRALEAWGDQLSPPNWIMGAIGNVLDP